MKTKLIVVLSLVSVLMLVFYCAKEGVENESKQSIKRALGIEPGDLLALYAEKPSHLKFKKRVAGQGQVSLNAVYEVEGKHSQSVEDFLVEKYGMGKLKWVCCGYENANGKQGEITVQQDKENGFLLLISMHGNAEKTDKQNRFYLEPDREKLTFIVSVKRLFNDDF